MEDNKFFKLVWRINGLIILGGATLIALFVVYNIAKDFIRSSNRPQPVVVENLASDPEDKEKWVIGSPIHVTGNDFMLLPLVSENKEVKMLSVANFSKPSYDKRYYGNLSKNILFLDKKENKSFWLFKDTNRLILNITLFPDQFNNVEPTKAIFYNVVSKDTNKDKKLTKEDDSSLFMSTPEGENYQLILEAYDRLISRDIVGDNQILLVFQNKGKAFSRLIQLLPYKIISSVELPKVENS